MQEIVKYITLGEWQFEYIVPGGVTYKYIHLNIFELIPLPQAIGLYMHI